MPKVDCLVDGSLRRADILARLGLDPARPTILHAPTWSAASSLNLMGVELIDGLLRRSWNVIVKLHDRSRDPRPFYSGGVDWVGRLSQLMTGRGGHLADGADICPYLAAADVMITDHSSAGFEYLLLDRPLVRIHVPELLRSSNINEDYVALLAEAAASVDDHTAALTAVERGLAEPAARSGSRQQVAGDLFYKAGTATARAVHELYDAMELEPAAALAPARGREAVAS
jgi:CDP-glycerol glycerophosphotransferase (TagB/SpsB family)